MKLQATTEKVSIKWFVVVNGVKMPHESSMRGSWGYDAECSCGWETISGGAIKSCIQDLVREHKQFDHNYSMNFGA